AVEIGAGPAPTTAAAGAGIVIVIVAATAAAIPDGPRLAHALLPAIGLPAVEVRALLAPVFAASAVLHLLHKSLRTRVRRNRRHRCRTGRRKLRREGHGQHSRKQ